MFARLTELIAVRQATPEFAGNELWAFHAHVDSVVGFTRPGTDGTHVLVLANVGDDPVWIDALTLSGWMPDAVDLLSGETGSLEAGLKIPAHGFWWLRVRERV